MMFKNTVLTVIGSALLFACSTSQKATDSACAKSCNKGDVFTKQDSASYALGILMAENLKKDNIDTLINERAFYKGFSSALNNQKYLFSKDSAGLILNNFIEAEREKEFMVAKEQGRVFLEKNALRPEVTRLPSGLQYEIVKMGTGTKPGLGSQVKTHYHGTLINGQVFDSSINRGEPVVFPVNQVIAGWTEALQLMPIGSKWKLYIPYDLAYGKRSTGPIPPYSTLIFDIELLDIVE